MVFDHTDDKGTIVAISVKGKFSHPERVDTAIFRNAKMDFLWVHFNCSKCGWGRCTTSNSEDVVITDDAGIKMLRNESMNVSTATSTIKLIPQPVTGYVIDIDGIPAGTSIPEPFFFAEFERTPSKRTYKNKKFVERKLRKMGR